MTEETMVQEVTPKSKMASAIRWVLLGGMLALLLFTVIMAVYRKFLG